VTALLQSDRWLDAFPQAFADRVALARCRKARRNPRTFNEKLLYKMVWDRRPILVTYADKVAAADYIERRLGPGYTPDRHLVTDDLGAVDRYGLPQNFVVKNSHLSGGVVVVFDRADPSVELQAPADVYERRAVRPENLDWNRLVDVSEAWLETTFVNALNPCGEWMYAEVPPRLVIEELVLGPAGALPDDLRFFVFNGTCRVIRTACGIVGGGKTIDHFWPDWSPIDVTFLDPQRVPRASPTPSRPERLSEMIELAETLASETDFLRVDMFDTPDRIVVGELTSFPSAGNGRWDPPDLDLQMGDFWRLPRRYRAVR
jgi:hypothetical protein